MSDTTLINLLAKKNKTLRLVHYLKNLYKYL